MLIYRGRPDSLRKFVSAYLNTNALCRVCVALEDLNGYEDINLPPTFIAAQAPKDSCLGDIINMAFKAFPKEAWYGYIPENILPETPQWDAVLAAACTPDKIVLDGFCFMGGDLVRKLGWFAAPPLKNYYIEDTWEIIGKILKAQVQTDIKMAGKEKDGVDTSSDKIAFESFRRFELPAILEKLL